MTLALIAIVFINAALLFTVEPMISKLVLPMLGGTPSVWNTCLVFFQAALLAGYGYAHLLSLVRNPAKRTAFHVACLAASCLALPLAIRAFGDPPPGNLGIFWLLGVLVMSLGAPFLMLSSGTPLAQRWLAESGEHNAHNPYFLYAASNFGSFAALIAYPTLIEPRLTLSAQRRVWSAGYLILVVLIASVFAIIAHRAPQSAVVPKSDAPPITNRERLRWIIYSAVPASLLVGVTTFISTDVAAVPLLWVVPLSIYLLTFVIVFSSRPLLRPEWMGRAEPHVLVIISIPIFWSLRLPGLFGIIVHLAGLFVIAMVCHGELARTRPPASHLTEFFVWVALGGLIGGMFNALIAPVVFNGVYEYPIVLALAGALLYRTRRTGLSRMDVAIPAALGILLFLVTRNMQPLPDPVALVTTMAFGILIFSFRNRPLRFGFALAAVFVAGHFRATRGSRHVITLDAERSFFGAYRVSRQAGSNHVTLFHGTTLHGIQSLDPAIRLKPLSYYHPSGPAGDIFGFTKAGTQFRRRVGIVGLGAGSLACYGHAAEHWTFYEIDPVVTNIALDRRYFTFLRDCPPSIRIVAGDARLTLAKAPNASYDILVIDAFSSDAIPVHLLTREAFMQYLRVLAPHGVLALHISNDHLDLEPVVAATAGEQGLTALVRRDLSIPPEDVAEGRAGTVWTILARSPEDVGRLVDAAKWEQLRARAHFREWTDDFSNILQVFNWR